MLKYYKEHIFVLKNMLNMLDPTDENLDSLLEIQKYIIKRIVNTEKRIRTVKTERKKLRAALSIKGNTKEVSIVIKTKIRNLENKIHGYNFLLYVWRCFGDGIVFKYISKWNLKRLLFESGSPNIKPPCGFISDKSGLAGELSLVFEATEKRVPAILCDITNTIRHGDVCLLGASDPFVLEVKSSSVTSKRIDRQLESIQCIHNYLETDVGDIAGAVGMRRVALPTDERHHNESINAAIENAMRGSHSICTPERGARYIALNTNKVVNHDKVFEGLQEPIIFSLNECKTTMRWDNYYPFTLSIKSDKALYSFLSGSVFVIVALDGSIMKKMAKAIGYELEIIMSNNIGFKFTEIQPTSDEPAQFSVSEHFAGRLGLEFLSLEWFFEHEKHLMDQMKLEVMDAILAQGCNMCQK